MIESPQHLFPLHLDAEDCNWSPLLCNNEFNEEDGNGSENDEGADVFISPNGSSLWVPSVAEIMIPHVGSTFENLEDAYVMYQTYALAGGFSVRVGQQKKYKGVVTHKYLRCNRAGKPQPKKKFALSTECRQSTYIRNNCKAHICLKISRENGCLSVLKFVEGHNHSLVEGFNKDLTKLSRRLPFSTKKYILDMSMNRIGPVKAHRLMVSMMGGHHNVNGTPSDFKNFSKTTRMHIGDRDTHILLNRFQERRKIIPNYYFDYLVDDERLRSIFWADEISKVNYEAFGDVLAFDATYQTNKYNMIFVPFTGVDNHRHCVTFGAGLIFSETTESYKWLLECFLKAHKRHPSLVLTDQDPSMRQAVLQVFPTSRHRLCMWHIMKKLPSKISGDLMQNTDIRSRIHRLVWSNYMKTTTFEKRWKELMEEFSLTDHDWLTEMYNIRERWVPAYFRDIPMCGLLRTTSVCESSNSSFKVNSTSANTLVQFMMCFESRVEQQRYKQRTSDYKSSTVFYNNSEAKPIQKHAFQLYTSTIFLEVQKEIKQGMQYCYISDTQVLGVTHVYSVCQVNPNNGSLNTYEVKYNTVENTGDCSCMCFTHIGYLCRHVFCAFQVNRLNEIPSMYISKRWTRDALPRSIYKVENRYGVDISVESMLRKQVLEMVNQCVDDLRADKSGLEALVEKVKGLKKCISACGSDSIVVDNSNGAVVQELVGQEMNVEVSVNNPNVLRTKGCGKRRRVSGPGEKMREKPPKAPRLCRTCNEYVTDHDSRNCKTKKKGKDVESGESSDEA